MNTVELHFIYYIFYKNKQPELTQNFSRLLFGKVIVILILLCSHLFTSDIQFIII